MNPIELINLVSDLNYQLIDNGSCLRLFYTSDGTYSYILCMGIVLWAEDNLTEEEIKMGVESVVKKKFNASFSKIGKLK